ncbi:hypothetical protein AGR6A_Cc120152 [Agrobacterium sp. NCPPB 925]|nr:hypothetical protein AGR6A_Cc120152 [Agrobacterium sp. NCPPB 925]
MDYAAARLEIPRVKTPSGRKILAQQ